MRKFNSIKDELETYIEDLDCLKYIKYYDKEIEDYNINKDICVTFELNECYTEKTEIELAYIEQHCLFPDKEVIDIDDIEKSDIDIEYNGFVDNYISYCSCYIRIDDDVYNLDELIENENIEFKNSSVVIELENNNFLIIKIIL